jgi:hypothetical protein
VTVFDHANDTPQAGDAVFAMDPQAALLSLAHQLVTGQRMMADLTRATQAADRVGQAAPEVLELQAKLRETQSSWYTGALPSIAAGMRLAIEVLETFGPGFTRIEDDIEAAVWNNKFHVWVKEFNPQQM